MERVTAAALAALCVLGSNSVAVEANKLKYKGYYNGRFPEPQGKVHAKASSLRLQCDDYVGVRTITDADAYSANISQATNLFDNITAVCTCQCDPGALSLGTTSAYVTGNGTFPLFLRDVFVSSFFPPAHLSLKDAHKLNKVLFDGFFDGQANATILPNPNSTGFGFYGPYSPALPGAATTQTIWIGQGADALAAGLPAANTLVSRLALSAVTCDSPLLAGCVDTCNTLLERGDISQNQLLNKCGPGKVNGTNGSGRRL